MTRSLNSDPLRNFRFQVAINHPDIKSFVRMGFMSVSGLAVQSEVIPYKEGGNNTTTRKMPGQSDYGPISLNRGMLAAPVGDSAAGTHEAYDWFTEIFSVQAGQGLGNGIKNFRVGVNIDVLAHPITVGPGAAGLPVGAGTVPPIKARFQVFNAWPMGLSYSDLEAGGNAVVIERLDLAHEGWLLLTASQADGNYLPTDAGFAP
jgi:phage tail-like protein